MNYRQGIKRRVFQLDCVDKDNIAARFKLLETAVHTLFGSVKYVYFVYLPIIYYRNSIFYCPFSDYFKQFLAFGFRQKLAVVHAVNQLLFPQRHNRARGHNGTGKRASARFVHSGNKSFALSDKFSFVIEFKLHLPLAALPETRAPFFLF